MQPEARIEAGRDALRRRAWLEAYDLLSDPANDGALSAEDYEGLSRAAWFTGRLDPSIAASERAFAIHTAEGRTIRAAHVALWLAKDNVAKGSHSVGAGWLKRAENLLDAQPNCVEHGYLARMYSLIAFEVEGDNETALAEADRALDIARRFADRDLEAMALQYRGRVLIDMGKVDEGKALFDEANAAAVSGELSPMTTGVVYCNTITACEHITDYGRAAEWTDVAQRWCERQAIGGFPGVCRVHAAGIIRRRGAWVEAEEEARRACVELEDFYLAGAAEAFYEVGLVRLRMGDLDGAEAAFGRANEFGRNPQPGLALARLAQGKPERAQSAIQRALSDEDRDLHRAQLLPARAEISLALGDLDTAESAAEELERIAGDCETPALQAMAASARGSTQLTRGETAAAAESFRRATLLWQKMDAPYEAARARLDLAAAYRASGDAESAAEEAAAAKAVFERLGAVPDVRRATELEPGPESQPVTRTFLFTDIADSTRLLEVIGDEAWDDLARWHDETLRHLFSEHGGEEIDHAGDGFFVAFDEAGAALECAVAIQRRLARQRREHGFAPKVRVGVHAAGATQAGAVYRGRGVHEAARLAGIADGDEIVASRATVDCLSGVAVENERSVELKGIREPVEVVSIAWTA